MIRGGDISRFQTSVDFVALRAAGVRFLLIEAQEGNDRANPLFDVQVAAARAAGIDVGAYLYIYPLPNAPGHVNRDPRGQAELFFNASRGLGSQLGDLPPFLDMEYPSPKDWPTWGCSKDQIRAWLLACRDEVRTLFGRTPGIYVDPDFYAHIDPEGDLPIADSPLWLAEYPGPWDRTWPPDGTPSPKPPKPFPNVAIWQHGCKLRLPQAGGAVFDGDVFLGDEDAYQELLNTR